MKKLLEAVKRGEAACEKLASLHLNMDNEAFFSAPPERIQREIQVAQSLNLHTQESLRRTAWELESRLARIIAAGFEEMDPLDMYRGMVGHDGKRIEGKRLAFTEDDVWAKKKWFKIFPLHGGRPA